MEKLDLFKKERLSVGIDTFRSLPIDEQRAKITIGEDRVIKGYAIVWGSKNSHDEIVLKGATLNSLNARGVGSTKNSITFLKYHKIDQPIARMLVLQEDDYGLYFEAEIIKTALGNETIEEITSGVLRQLSYGFSYVWDKTEYDADADAYILREIKLYEISLVTFSSDENAQLRGFAEFQKSQIMKDITSEQLRSLINIANSELKSRDEHSTSEDDAKQWSNVTIF